MRESFSREQLTNPDYSIHPRVQVRYIGEPWEKRVAIRPIFIKDHKDIRRMHKITHTRVVQEWMDEVKGMSEEDIQEWVAKSATSPRESDPSNPDWEIVYAITQSGLKTEADRAHDPVSHEVGELQGFVNTYTNTETREVVRKADYLLNAPITQETQIVEISVAKWRKSALRDIAGSAIRQACLEINKLVESDPKSVSPHAVIAAFIDPENVHSVHAFEAAFFENKGLVQYDDKTEIPMYVLNWEKLDTFLHVNADREVFTS